MEMDLGMQSDPLMRCADSPGAAKAPSDKDYLLESSKTTAKVHNVTDLALSLITPIVQNDKAQFISLSRILFDPNGGITVDRTSVSRLLHICCAFDSAECAASLINGELGAVPLMNEVDSAGMSPLHAAAEAHAARCVELLLRKRARTDLKTRDGRGLLPLELSLSRTRIDVKWNPDLHSIEDLVVQLGETGLTSVKLLSEKTKEIEEVAYASAIGGRVVDLAALLVVAAEKVNKFIVELHDADFNSKEKTSIYECVIREALRIGRTATSPSAANRNCCPTKGESDGRRKLLLCEIELLQLFGAVALTGCTDKKVTSPLILAAQAGDECIIELLLKTNIDVNDADAEGNSALHWCLKTFKGACSQQIKIMSLLLKHGARVNHKNKLGLTAVHIAAGNGNAQALEDLLLQDSDCVNSKTETKETPLFFAVKNDYKECAELLLHWGASTEVFNLRKQRPIDLAESQDMRFLLNPTNISLTSRAFTKYTAFLQGDEVISETCEELLTMVNEGNSSDRTCFNTKTEICRYFASPTGCVRGSKCFYVHAGEEIRQMKQGTEMIHLSSAWGLERKIFVGRLPSSIDSDLLRKLFEEKFGLVDDAMVVGGQTGDKTKSRGFGFVTFKHKKSVSAAVEAHYVTIMGKQIEIRSALPQYLLLSESQKSPCQQEQEQSNQHLPQEQTPRERNTKEMADWQILTRKAKLNMHSQQLSNEKKGIEVPGHKTAEEAKSKQMSWVDTLVSGQPKACSNYSQIHKESMPAWLRTFKKWLPNFLQQVARRDGEYALSSLKADFRTAFGLELDHASLGFSKLSDFMRSLPDLCQITFVPTGKQKPANHMILLPGLRKPVCQPFQLILSPSCHASECSYDSKSGDTEGSLDVSLVSNENDVLPESVVFHQNSGDNPEDTSVSVHSTFLQFLQPDAIFHARPWLFDECYGGTEYALDGKQVKFKGMKPLPHQGHLVLEALARKRNNSSVFFLREFDFFDNYKATIVQGRCLGCNQRRVLWVNFPCRHLLWCDNCREEFMLAANGFEHKCVVCDIKVQKIDLISWHEYCQTTLDKAQIDKFSPSILTTNEANEEQRSSDMKLTSLLQLLSIQQEEKGCSKCV